MRKSSKLIAAVAVAGLAAAGGSAFTAGNTAPTTQTVGYSATSVSGGTVNSLKYNLSTAGDNVNTVTLVLANNTTASAVSLGFNGGATTSCGAGTATTVAPITTTYTCNNAGANFVQSTSGLTSTAVVIN